MGSEAKGRDESRRSFEPTPKDQSPSPRHSFYYTHALLS